MFLHNSSRKFNINKALYFQTRLYFHYEFPIKNYCLFDRFSLSNNFDIVPCAVGLAIQVPKPIAVAIQYIPVCLC